MHKFFVIKSGAIFWGVEVCEAQYLTSLQCVLSVEHGVIWPLDSSTASMKAGVNSRDACHANQL